MSQPYPSTPSGEPAKIPNYMVPAILGTILCCVPTGIASIVFATQVNAKLAAGDTEGALASSKKAKLWMFISSGLGLLVWIIAILLNIGLVVATISGSR